MAQNPNAMVLSMLQAKVGSADWSQWQIHRWQFYDYVRYVNGTTNIQLFTNATGSTDPNSLLQKTLEQTNMPKSGTFGQVYFIVNQIRCHVSILPKVRQLSQVQSDTTFCSGAIGDAATAVNDLFRRGVLTWTIGQKMYQQIERPFLAAPPGFGIEIEQISAARATPVIIPRQSYFSQDVWTLTPPQMVEPEQNFTLNIQFDTAAPTITVSESGTRVLNTDIGVIFDGYIARPAQ